jgi:sensor histidine kinase regulating citrate/malate metabolism
MRLIGRMSLQTKVLLIQVGIVLLVAGLISGTVVSVLANLVEQQAGERALGIAPPRRSNPWRSRSDRLLGSASSSSATAT